MNGYYWRDAKGDLQKVIREWIEVNELFLELATWGTFDITEDDVMDCRLELEAIRSEMLTISEG